MSIHGILSFPNHQLFWNLKLVYSITGIWPSTNSKYGTSQNWQQLSSTDQQPRCWDRSLAVLWGIWGGLLCTAAALWAVHLNNTKVALAHHCRQTFWSKQIYKCGNPKRSLEINNFLFIHLTSIYSTVTICYHCARHWESEDWVIHVPCAQESQSLVKETEMCQDKIRD